MLEGLFENTVSALCYEIAGREGPAAPYNDVVRFVLLQHAKMPRVLGWGVRAGTVVFALAALRHGALFHRLRPARRRLQVDAWSISRLQACRDLIKLYSSLAIFAVYSRPGYGG
jgi:hypothetical protein